MGRATQPGRRPVRGTNKVRCGATGQADDKPKKYVATHGARLTRDRSSRIVGGGDGAKGGDDTISLMVNPSAVVGIEVYPYPVGVPPRYQALNGMCGVVLIWTK